jgi:hypothetical protein
MEKFPDTEPLVPSDLEQCQQEVPCLDDYVPTCLSSDLGREIWEESKKVLSLVAPVGFNRVFTYAFGVVTQAYAGQFGTLELAAVSLAISTIGGISFGLMVRNQSYSIVLKDLLVLLFKSVLHFLRDCLLSYWYGSE